MTRIVLEIKNERQVALLRTILNFLNISIVKEERQHENGENELEAFYKQFQLDLSQFNFDRQEANER